MPQKIPITLNENVLNVVLEERLDIGNSTKLIEELNKYREDENITEVVFDARKLIYIASTGIRAALFAKQSIGNNPKVTFIGASADVYHIFDMTGLTKYIEFKDTQE